MKPIIAILIVILPILFFISCNKSNKTSQSDEKSFENTEKVMLTAEQIAAIKLHTGVMSGRLLNATVKANGVVSVLNQNKAVINTLFGGSVQTITVHEGDKVRKGQVIARVVSPNFIAVQEEYLIVKAQLSAGNAAAVATVSNAQYGSLQEQMSTLQPQIVLAQQEVARQKELTVGNAGSLKLLQTAESNLAAFMAKSAVLQAQINAFTSYTNSSLQTRKAALEQKFQLLGVNYRQLTNQNLQASLPIYSPISGTIGTIAAKIGSLVGENAPIAEVIDLNNLHLDLNVYEPAIAGFSKGQRLTFSLLNQPGQIYSAEVHTIAAMLDPTTKTIEVHAHIEGRKDGLMEGMSVVATTLASKNAALSVPNAAIVTENTKNYIFVQTATSKTATTFLKTMVELGVTDGVHTEILPSASLNANTVVALDSAFFLLGKMNETGEE